MNLCMVLLSLLLDFLSFFIFFSRLYVYIESVIGRANKEGPRLVFVGISVHAVARAIGRHPSDQISRSPNVSVRSVQSLNEAGTAFACETNEGKPLELNEPRTVRAWSFLGTISIGEYLDRAREP